jgi:hypothetical protein
VRNQVRYVCVMYRCCQREFKPQGYYAECIDLVRKLVLSGMVSLLSPGTVVQSFVTAVFSLIFMVIHAHICKPTGSLRQL